MDSTDDKPQIRRVGTCIGYPASEGTSGSYFAENGLMFGINSGSDCKEEVDAVSIMQNRVQLYLNERPGA